MPKRARKNEKEEKEMSLPSYMRPETPQGETPKLTLGEQLETKIQSIEKVSGQYGDQYQIDSALDSGWNARAWIKYYAVPAPNQHLGKLCLAIERVTGQTFSSVEQAVNALKSYGRIYLKVSGFRTFEGKEYPKFAVFPDILPGEEASAPSMQRPTQPISSGLPSALPTSVSASSVSSPTLEWVIANQNIIGQKIPPEIYNKTIGDGILEELHELGYIKTVHDYPWLGENTRQLL